MSRVRASAALRKHNARGRPPTPRRRGGGGGSAILQDPDTQRKSRRFTYDLRCSVRILEYWCAVQSARVFGSAAPRRPSAPRPAPRSAAESRREVLRDVTEDRGLAASRSAETRGVNQNRNRARL